MTPGQRKTMLLACLHGAAHALTYEHSPKWGANAGRALDDARTNLGFASNLLSEVTPVLADPPAMLRSEVDGVALNLATMTADALRPGRPVATDAALMGVVATLRHALDEIAKETP